MKNMHAYLGAGNLCAEIHLSKVLFAPADQQLFDDVLATARLRTDVSAPSQAMQPMDYVREGSRSYLQRNFKASAELYQKALDMEKQKRTLDQTVFRVLVDNLGMSYAFTGNLPKSKEIFEYGVTQDPEYPMFYYNLACTYGEMGKMDESLEQLRIAYKYKANVIAGESFPDPMRDDSFRKFVKDKRFVDEVKKMKQP
jgi:predicted Zn-dependent protease